MSSEQSMPLINKTLSLDKLLRYASPAQLSELADIITDSGKGRLVLTENSKKNILAHQRRRALHIISADLAREICAFGGNTVVNAFRSTSQPSYLAVATDVAKKMGVKVPKNASVCDIEELIIKQILTTSFKGKSKAEIETLFNAHNCKFDNQQLEQLLKKGKTADLVSWLYSTCGPYTLSRLVNSAMVPALNVAAKAGIPLIGKAIAIRAPAMMNPIAAVISAAWVTYDLTGPAFRITLPAVIRIACIRQAYIRQETDKFCQELKKCL